VGTRVFIIRLENDKFRAVRVEYNLGCGWNQAEPTDEILAWLPDRNWTRVGPVHGPEKANHE
jgi:hypothetical protein